MILVRYTIERPRFNDHLEAIKFICKDFWFELFKKQIDNLKTNHRVSFWPLSLQLEVIVKDLYSSLFIYLLQGTFVLQDNKFRWLSRVSVDPSVEISGAAQEPSVMSENKSAQATGLHLYFPCGIIRGALSTLGIPCAVSADISNLPACKFSKFVRLKSRKSNMKMETRRSNMYVLCSLGRAYCIIKLGL